MNKHIAFKHTLETILIPLHTNENVNNDINLGE